MRQDLIEFERDEISMAKELNKKIGTNITTIRESLEKIEAIMNGAEMTAEDGNYLADTLKQTNLDMAGSLTLLEAK
jgi:hypothetical protein